MKKTYKILFSLLSVCIMLSSYFLIVNFQGVAQLSFSFSDIYSYIHNNIYYNYFMFSIGLILFFISFLFFISLFFIPKKEKFFELFSVNEKKVSIKKKAIEAIITIKAEETNFLRSVSSKVKFKSKNKKISAEIFCKSKDVVDFSERSSLFLSELQQDISRMLDIEPDNIKLSLKVVPEKIKSTKKRVL